jgi:pimeloyl-ACP methyl ester carboxylesterase
MIDVLIPSNDLLIAAQEWSGAGPPLLLLHGMGATLLNWAAVIPHLSKSHRVICMDLRNHGHSGSGSWTWDAVINDVDAVLTHFDAQDAILVGHSLGGVIAALYAGAHPETRGIVNLDGFGLGDPDEYATLPRDAAEKCIRRLIEMVVSGYGVLYSSDDVDSMVKESMQEADQFGIPRALYELSIRRRLQSCEGRTFRFRPDQQQWRELWGQFNQLDVFGVLELISCPALVVSATDTGSEMTDIDGLATMMAERVAIVQEQLAALARNPSITVRRVDATHNLISEIPADVASMIADFALSISR